MNVPVTWTLHIMRSSVISGHQQIVGGTEEDPVTPNSQEPAHGFVDVVAETSSTL